MKIASGTAFRINYAGYGRIDCQTERLVATRVLHLQTLRQRFLRAYKGKSQHGIACFILWLKENDCVRRDLQEVKLLDMGSWGEFTRPESFRPGWEESSRQE